MTTSPSLTSQWLTTREACALLKIKRTSLWRYSQRLGLIRRVMPSRRHTLYWRADCEHLYASIYRQQMGKSQYLDLIATADKPAPDTAATWTTDFDTAARTMIHTFTNRWQVIVDLASGLRQTLFEGRVVRSNADVSDMSIAAHFDYLRYVSHLGTQLPSDVQPSQSSAE